MSADNRICIMQDRYGQWCVWHGSASCDYHEPPPCGLVTRYDTQRQATKAAHKREEELAICEYGIELIGVSEQEQALISEITDLTERLANLRATKSQWPEQEQVL